MPSLGQRAVALSQPRRRHRSVQKFLTSIQREWPNQSRRVYALSETMLVGYRKYLHVGIRARTTGQPDSSALFTTQLHQHVQPTDIVSRKSQCRRVGRQPYRYCWLWVERIRRRQNFANAYPVSAYSTGCKTTDMVVRIHSTASFWKSSMLDEHGNPSPFPALVTDHRLIDQTLN